MERRSVALTELRTLEDTDNPRRLRGMAVVYDSPADIAGVFTERIAPGALSNWLRSGENVRLLYEHQGSAHLASTQAGTLTLRDTDAGLMFEATVAATTVGNDVLQLVRSGELKNCSFAYLPTKEGETWTKENDTLTRTITDVEIMPEITLTSNPAFDATHVMQRSVSADTLAHAKALAAMPTLAERTRQLRELQLHH
ncbi:MAG: HK97 family phage prohead protease [Planctomycetota bacterium]